MHCSHDSFASNSQSGSCNVTLQTLDPLIPKSAKKALFVLGNIIPNCPLAERYKNRDFILYRELAINKSILSPCNLVRSLYPPFQDRAVSARRFSPGKKTKAT
jgi:hypothetical protein